MNVFLRDYNSIVSKSGSSDGFTFNGEIMKAMVQGLKSSVLEKVEGFKGEEAYAEISR